MILHSGVSLRRDGWKRSAGLGVRGACQEHWVGSSLGRPQCQTAGLEGGEEAKDRFSVPPSVRGQRSPMGAGGRTCLAQKHQT